MPSWVIWVIVAIVVVAVIAAVVAASNKKKQERDRNRAGEMREQATAQASEVQQREARAKETEAQAAQARAEADRKRAEAERLEAEAQDRHQTAAGARDEHADNLRQADELDPDVDTKRDDYVAPGTTGATDATGGSETHQRTEPRTAGDLAGDTHDGHATEPGTGETGTSTVTHPDGSTETVSDPAAGGQSNDGTHRA